MGPAGSPPSRSYNLSQKRLFDTEVLAMNFNYFVLNPCFYCLIFYPSFFGKLSNDVLLYFGNTVKMEIECVNVVYMIIFFYFVLEFPLMMACV